MRAEPFRSSAEGQASICMRWPTERILNRRKPVGSCAGSSRSRPRRRNAELCGIDPESARVIHPNNSKRVIRAIEYYRQCGRKISEHNSELKQKESPYELYYFVLSRKREELYERIEQRVDRMMADGLVEEVKRLREAGCSRNMVSMQGLGYKEILDALDGITSLEEAVRILKRDTRHFAKRQLTWFRREDAIWIDMDAEDPLAEVLKNISCRNTPHVV